MPCGEHLLENQLHVRSTICTVVHESFSVEVAAYTFKKTKLSAVKVLFPMEDDQ